MIGQMRFPAVVMVAVLAMLTPPALAQDGLGEPDDVDRQILDGFLEQTRQVPQRVSTARVRQLVGEAAENLRWQVLPYLEMPLVAYEITGERQYLDLFVEAFANLEAVLTEGPDGYLGWFGPALGTFQHPDHPDRHVDVHINSFVAAGLLARFVEFIDADDALAERYADERERYLDLARNHLVRKWIERGNYVELGERGAIYRTHADLAPTKGHLTQPINKLEDAVTGLLALYRVTGEHEYMEQAVRIGTFFKRTLTMPNDHYTWTYWTPAGEWDIHPEDDNRWKHWIGAEHRAGYYGSSVALAVELYHHGVVFDETDMQRFLNTQLHHAWNGSLDDPQFSRVDGSDGPQSGSYIATPLAVFSDHLAEYIFRGARREARLDSATHPWQGGPAARGWVYGRFVYLDKAAGGERTHAEVGERFRQTEQGRALLEELAFEVQPPGYRQPRSPREMRPMVREPR